MDDYTLTQPDMPDDAPFHWASRWTTAEELGFLHGLGRWRGTPARPSPPISPSTRIAMLREYQRNMLARTDWGDIDPLALNTGIEALIDEIRRTAWPAQT